MPNDKVGQDAFAVIRDAMKGKGMVGVGRVVISKRERPIILEPFGKGMRGMTLRYPYEVRKEDEYFADIPDVKIPGEMLKLAEHIVETKDGRFRPVRIRGPVRNGRGRAAEAKAGRQACQQDSATPGSTADRQRHRPAEAQPGDRAKGEQENESAVAGARPAEGKKKQKAS